METTNVIVILAFHKREVSRGILNYVSSTGSHLTLTKAKNVLFFPVGVENEQLRSTSIINDTFSGSCPEMYRFFLLNLICKGKINNVKPVFGIG
ncbi:hypothetical protein [Exiguobacterium sp. s130]|uniref:hypothetical protein n=1 Tax=Exiguobacterium sp. s130 TaxID=2751190 RepID=UPI001BEC6B84|nr:hypothetical protein [Exiguobacterium sp. s130]